MNRRATVALVLMFCLVATIGRSQEQPQVSNGQDPRIPKGARIFITPLENGYHVYLAAAIQKKEVPVVVVIDKAKADFELSAVTESEKAGWAKMLFMKSGASAEQASIMVVNVKTGTVVFGYNVNKSSSARGKQSSSEACAKHLKEKIESAR
jgi:hypothetical protein